MRFTQTEQEYMALYPERVKDGRIFCGCGASNMRITCNSIYVCAVCNTQLYMSAYDKNPTITEVAHEEKA
jgi:hypothetical protein